MKKQNYTQRLEQIDNYLKLALDVEWALCKEMLNDLSILIKQIIASGLLKRSWGFVKDSEDYINQNFKKLPYNAMLGVYIYIGGWLEDADVYFENESFKGEQSELITKVKELGEEAEKTNGILIRDG